MKSILKTVGSHKPQSALSTRLRKKINDDPRYSKIYTWWKLVTITASTQVIVQIAALITGILIIRLLPTREYAYYTLANTMLGTMTVLADGGISTGVLSFGGKVWNDREKLGAVLATGLYLRRKFAVISLGVSVPILVYLLFHQHAGWLTIVTAVLALIPAFYSALSDSLLEIVPKLHQDIKSLQLNQLKVAISRFLLSIVSLFLAPFTFVALLANGIPRIYGNIQLRKITWKFADKNQAPSDEYQKSILKIVSRVLPGSLYYCISGQITIWLLSIFGSTTSVAQIGALSRLSIIFNVFTALFVTLIVPRFSKFLPDGKLLLRRFVQIQVGIYVLSGSLLALSFIFSHQILWVLGENFSSLTKEFILSMIASCLTLIRGITYSLNASRGWIIKPWISIPLNISFIIAGILFFNTSTLDGILQFNILISGLGAIMVSAYSLISIYKVKESA